MKTSVLGTALLLLSSVLTSAQSAQRVAVIDSGRLDKAGGIQRFIEAINVSLLSRPCHHRCGRMKDAIDALARETAELKCANRPLGDREARLQEAKNEYDKLLTFDKERYERNEAMFITPVVNDIRALANKFAAERNYAVIVDKFGLVFSSAVIVGEAAVPDVTLEFIQYCNAEFERRRTEKE